MANLSEILDPTQLDYDITAVGGFDPPDGNAGPPNAFNGWIRTGFSSNTAANAGSANCALWTSSSAAHNGTAIKFENVWTTAPSAISPWTSTTFTCDHTLGVWCVQD